MPLAARCAAIIVLFAGGCSRMIADRVLRPPELPQRLAELRPLPEEAKRRWKDSFHTLKYRAFDGTRLRAVYLVPRDKELQGLVVFLHALGNRKEEMLPLAEVFADAGYIAVAPDLRAHGQSGGRYSTFGAHESYDMVALLDALQKKGFDVRRVGAVGRSLGAATAIQWAGVDQRVKAVVAISPFADLRSEIEHLYASQRKNLSRTRVERIERAIQKEGKFSIDQVSPIQTVEDRAVALYLVHGENDQVVPPSESERIFAAATGPVVLQRVPHAGHYDVLQAMGPAFVQRTLQWMQTYLSAHPHPDTPPAWVWLLPHRNMPQQPVPALSAAVFSR